jgi:protein SCO1/2
MTQLLKDRPWTLGVVILVIAGAAFGVWSLTTTEAHEWNGATYDPPRALPSFRLTDANGEPFSTSALEGKVVLLYFGYSYCPDFCPATLTDFQRVKQALGDDADEVAFMMVSVDPQRDTPARLKEYLGFFDPAFIGLTGTEAELTPVKQEFGIIAMADEATPQANGENAYWVDHSTKTYVLNADGDLLLEYSFGTPAEDITEDVEYLLDS